MNTIACDEDSSASDGQRGFGRIDDKVGGMISGLGE